MERGEYLQLRNGLYSEAEQLINEGKIEEGEVKMQEITDLDNRFDNEAKALANLNALKDNIKISNTFPVNTQNKIGEIADEDFSNTTEYRKAFPALAAARSLSRSPITTAFVSDCSSSTVFIISVFGANP